jgi:hypothetical protein
LNTFAAWRLAVFPRPETNPHFKDLRDFTLLIAYLRRLDTARGDADRKEDVRIVLRRDPDAESLENEAMLEIPSRGWMPLTFVAERANVARQGCSNRLHTLA